MATGTEYAVVLALRAADQASAVVRAVRGRVNALRGSLAAFGRERLGTHHMVNGLHAVGQAANGVRKHLDFMLKPAIAAFGIGAAASAAGLWKLMRSSAEAGAEMKEMADRVGMPVERMKEWSYAAKQFGVDADTMNASVTILARGIGQAVNGTGKAKDVFEALGIKLTDSAGKVRATDSIMMALSEKMAKIPDAAERAAVATAILGKQGAALAPMFAEGGAKLEEFFARSRRFAVITDEGAEAQVRFNRSVQDLDMAAGGFGKTIATKLMPAVQPLVEALTEWMIANRQIIASQIGDVVKMIADGVKQIDLTGAVKGTLEFTRNVMTAVKVMGGFKPVLIAIGLYMAAGPIASTMQLVGAFAKLSGAVLATGARIGVVMAGQAVGAVMTFFNAMRAGQGVMVAFNAVCAANPIGLIVLAVTALIAGVVLLYEKWQPFHDFVDKTVAKIKEMIASVGGWLAKKLGLDLSALKPSAEKPPAEVKSAEGKPAAAPTPGPEGKSPAAARPFAVPNPALPAAPVAMPALPPQPAALGSGEVTVRILSEAPAKVESVKTSGGNLSVATDLAVGHGSAGR